MLTWLLRLHVSDSRLRPGLSFQKWLILLAICFALLRSCVASWAGRSHKSKVGVTPVGPGCLPKVLRGLGMSSHGSHVFWYSVPSSSLLIIVLQPHGSRPLYFWYFVEILLLGVMPIFGQSLCLWICLAHLSLVLSGIIYGFPWLSLRQNLTFTFPLRLDWDDNNTLDELCWWYYSCPRDIRIILLGKLCHGIPIRTLLGCLVVPQSLGLSHF